MFASRTRYPALLTLASAIEPVGTLWVNSIRMTVVPLVVALLITRIASASSGAVGKIGGRALVLFAAFAGSAAALTAIAAPPIIGALRFDPVTIAALRKTAVATDVKLPPFSDWLTALVPANPMKAAADGTLLPLAVFTIIFALGLTRVRSDYRDSVSMFFTGVSDAMLVLVKWIIAVSPVGVFALALALAARGGLGVVSVFGQLVLVVCGLVLVTNIAIYPIACMGGRVPFRVFARACAPAQAVGFSTRSSLASLPIMIDTAQHRLGVPPQVAGLVLPIAVSIFKFGMPTARLAGSLFIARVYGVHLGGAEVMALAASIAALSFYTPGIPSGALFIMTPVFMMFGLPAEGIGLLLAVDLVPDMFVTLANVTADMTVVVLLARRQARVGSTDPESVAPVAA